VGEQRDLSGKTASFFCLDQTTGRVKWEKATFAEQWWIGIEAVHRDMVFLHKFAAPDLPEHKAIIAVDLLKGTLAWSNEEVTFIGARDEYLYAALDSLEGRKILEMDYRTGAVLRLLGTEGEMMGEGNFESPLHATNSLHFPVAADGVAALSPYTAVQLHCHGKNITGAVEILDYDDRLVMFNYHERPVGRGAEDGTLRNVLQVVEKGTGRVLFSDVLNSSAMTVVPDSFFVQHHTLYYIKERSRLIAVPLPDALPTVEQTPQRNYRGSRPSN
jgi:hypothetical protein